MTSMLQAMIMAGGSGTRFWPLSRRDKPKQFLRMAGDRSLIQSAFDRCSPLIPAARVWVVTNGRLAAETHGHLPEVADDHLLLEPVARNTAPCVGLAALCQLAADPEAVMVIMPADHVIQDVARFQADVQQAADLIAEDPRRLVLFGVPPTYPATGFGYIEQGAALRPGAFTVSSFREKPAVAQAQEYVAAGSFLWNCGIFVWRADRILQSLAQHEPALHALLEQLRPHLGQSTWDAALAEVFPKMKSISIDYAVLEKEQGIVVLRAGFDWDDVGSWEAMSRLRPADSDQNAVAGRYLGVNSRRCIIHTSPDHLIATIGMEDCIVVHTPTATLVAQRRDEDAIRQLIVELDAQGHAELL